MVRPLLPVLLLLGLALPGCGPRAPELGAPPLPEGMGNFDPRVVARIEEARAKVVAEPQRAQAWAELGMVYASERLRELALECYRAAETLDPRQPRWAYRTAITLAQSGALAEAQAAMLRSIALEPTYPPSHARLGAYHLEQGDLEGAERAFRRATELDSTYPGGWVGLARVALQRDQNAEASAILARLLAQDPEERTFRQLQALAQRQAGGPATAAVEDVLVDDEAPVWNDPWELEARAFRQNPGMLRVGRLLERGQAAEALALLQEERGRGVGLSETAQSFATAYLLLGRVEEAMGELDALLALEPEHTGAMLQKAQILDDRGQKEEALRLLERVTTVQPTFGGAFAAKGRKLALLGYHEPAVVAMRRALELGAGDYELRFQLGQSLIVLKRWPEALELFTALVAERADHGDAWLELAVSSLRTGSLEAGEQALARARTTGNASPRLFEDVERALRTARERRARKASEGDE